MTGEKNRFKSSEKLWNLDDKMLKTPTHDAMVLYLLDKKNLEPILEDAFGSKRIIGIESERPVSGYNGFINGYLDFLINYGGNYLIIEVKPFVDSFGAVLRQIKSYERFVQQDGTIYTKHAIPCLFTFDSRFDSQFKSQGVKVLHPLNNVTAEDMREMYGLINR